MLAGSNDPWHSAQAVEVVGAGTRVGGMGVNMRVARWGCSDPTTHCSAWAVRARKQQRESR